VKIDHADLILSTDGMTLRVRNVTTDKVLHMRQSAVETSQECSNSTLTDDRTGPGRTRSIVVDPFLDESHQISEGSNFLIIDPDASIAYRVGMAKPRCHVLDDDSVLLAVILGVSEEEG
jgi:hypothetical protein